MGATQEVRRSLQNILHRPLRGQEAQKFTQTWRGFLIIAGTKTFGFFLVGQCPDNLPEVKCPEVKLQATPPSRRRQHSH